MRRRARFSSRSSRGGDGGPAQQDDGQRAQHEGGADGVEDGDTPHAEDHAAGGGAEGAHQTHGEVG